MVLMVLIEHVILRHCPNCVTQIVETFKFIKTERQTLLAPKRVKSDISAYAVTPQRGTVVEGHLD